MITHENLKDCFDSLTTKEVNKVMNSSKDYILLWVHIFNAGYYATVKSYVYSDFRDNDAANNGQLFIDKDEFLRLFKESGSENKAFKNWV